VCDSNYYRIVANDASDACMACPPGLTCDGTSTVQPVVGGSVWEQDGAIYKLKSCPSGYFVSPASVDASNAALQECMPCGKGEECVTASCVTCSACQPGYYKAAVSTDACASCPANTYAETEGSTALSLCQSCQAKSSTPAAGQSSRRACACDKEYYLIISQEDTDDEALSCQVCPKGAVCSGDGECALRNEDAFFSCTDGTSSIVGTWVLDSSSGQYELTS